VGIAAGVKHQPACHFNSIPRTGRREELTAGRSSFDQRRLARLQAADKSSLASKVY
jgi:hypothetical protein